MYASVFVRSPSLSKEGAGGGLRTAGMIKTHTTP
jgi:hypothetical protein